MDRGSSVEGGFVESYTIKLKQFINYVYEPSFCMFTYVILETGRKPGVYGPRG